MPPATRRLRQAPVVRWFAVGTYAVVVAAYLTLGDLRTSFDEAPSSTGVYLVVSAAGIAVLAMLATWHVLWLLPSATIVFAVVYQELVWDRPPGVGEGMDYIGFYPTSVMYVLIFAIPYAACVTALHRELLGKSADGRDRALEP